MDRAEGCAHTGSPGFVSAESVLVTGHQQVKQI